MNSTGPGTGVTMHDYIGCTRILANHMQYDAKAVVPSGHSEGMRIGPVTRLSNTCLTYLVDVHCSEDTRFVIRAWIYVGKKQPVRVDVDGE
jgi:hypothetical protein